MTPKEKALSLYNKMREENSVMTANVRAKRQSLITVEEILNSLHKDNPYDEETDNMEWTSDDSWYLDLFKTYWQDVKQELLKL